MPSQQIGRSFIAIFCELASVWQCPEYGLIESFYPLLKAIEMYPKVMKMYPFMSAKSKVGFR